MLPTCTFGKSWRSFIFGKMAFDNEPVTLGGGRGMAFVTTDVARRLVDTPFDTADAVAADLDGKSPYDASPSTREEAKKIKVALDRLIKMP